MKKQQLNLERINGDTSKIKNLGMIVAAIGKFAFKDMRSKPIKTALMALVIGGLGSLSYHGMKEGAVERQAQNQLYIQTDTNRDGSITPDEVSAVYKELRLNYNAFNPKPLTLDQIRTYLDKHTNRINQ
ncbi:MAG: hypothetical protein Q8N99_07925 [Nanoarchaeota archaeon]|nr:hypothetical protein [Nanoarchaeota archaeon]